MLRSLILRMPFKIENNLHCISTGIPYALRAAAQDCRHTVAHSSEKHCFHVKHWQLCESIGIVTAGI